MHKSNKNIFNKIYNPKLKQSPRRQGKEREMHQQMRKSSKRYMYKMLYNPRLQQSTLLKFKTKDEV